MRIDTKRADTLCSFTSIRWGFSPGAWVLDITVSADVWTMDLTAAAHSQGKPKNPHNMFIIQTMTISRWIPQPFLSLRSALPMINLEIIKQKGWSIDSLPWEMKYYQLSLICWVHFWIYKRMVNRPEQHPSIISNHTWEVRCKLFLFIFISSWHAFNTLYKITLQENSSLKSWININSVYVSFRLDYIWLEFWTIETLQPFPSRSAQIYCGCPLFPYLSILSSSTFPSMLHKVANNSLV